MKSEFINAISACCTKAGLRAGGSMIIACSGGSDSMALALLTAEWAQQHQIRLVAVTVDHGLRSESAGEAKQVGAWLRKQGLQHHILHWEGTKPSSNLQEAAREARYRLLADYAKAQGIAHMMVAHTQDDQAETFLLRLKRGSGVDGLSAMAPTHTMNGITVLRPLLAFSRTQLQDYLKERKQSFVSDPSNNDTHYDRIKMRTLRPLLAQVGISDQRLVGTARNMARARDFLEQETKHRLEEYAIVQPELYAELSEEALLLHDEIALRILSKLVRTVGGQNVPLRLEETERLLVALRVKNFRGATLAGAVIAPHKGKILVYRELQAVEKPKSLKPDEPLVWDGRFVLTLRTKQKSLTVGALTQQGWLRLAKTHLLKCLYPDKKIAYSLPALRNKEGDIVCVPHLGVSTSEYNVSLTTSEAHR